MNHSRTTKTDKKKYLEPTFHFSRKCISVGENKGKIEKITVSELVRKGQCLLSFPDFEKFAKKGYEKSPIRAGKHTQFSEDGETLLAETIGYPRVDVMNLNKKDEPTLLISISPFVKVSANDMKAALILHPPIPNGFTAKSESLSELLQEAGINFGIEKSAFLKCQKIISNGYNDYYVIPIANGIPPEAGKDAYLQFAFEIGPIAGKILEDGTIDFRERKLMIGVSRGELLATKIPAVPGTPGMNVFGQKVEPEGGLPLDIMIKHDVEYLEENGEVRATKDGILTVVNDSEIWVCSKQDILGDVDFNTGNIDSRNSVIIHGAVQPGFKVKTLGDLEIQQEVMSATITSNANIVIKGGITGKKTVISSLGDVDLNFIEQGHIDSGGNVVVRKQSYYSDISAKRDIRCKPGSTIIGGNIIAGGHLTVDNVGSQNGKPSLLAAGVDIERLHLHNKLSQELIQQQDDIIQWLQRYGGSHRSKKIRKMEARVDETKMKLLKLNLIPGTILYSRVGALADKQGTEETMENAAKAKCHIENIFIDIQGNVFSGTRLRIGNRKLMIKSTISRRRFKLKKNLKQIIATPIK